MVIGDLIDRYEKLHLDLNQKGETQRWSLKPVRAYLGGLSLAGLTIEKVAAYRGSRAGDGVTPGTVRRELGALRAVLSWASRKALLPEGTVLPHIDLPPQSEAREVWLTEPQAEDLWRAVKGCTTRAALFVAIAMETAARARAIETLTWDRVDFHQGFIDFRVPGQRKTKKKAGVVPMSARLQAALAIVNVHLANPKAGYVLGHSGSTRKGYETLMRGLGLGHIKRHDLRRTWATLAVQRGVSLWDVAGVLGDSVETVTKHYAHHSPEHLRNAVNRGAATGVHSRPMLSTG